ncbi:MAG: L,D-transpeptidase [Phormidesmis sp. RL_2_1]|nr:L,D-transpeptidase [Phormidesmis sp. RL_2_1]
MLAANSSTSPVWAAATHSSAVAASSEPLAAPSIESTGSIESTESATILVLRLQARRVYLYSGDTLINSYPVAVGAAETPTPQGQFAISRMVVDPVWQSPWTGEVHPPGPNSALGLRWIEFTSNADGAFGFHGTPTVDSIGKAASNGCVRMYNEDVVELFSQVEVGTPVLVEP